ncbi:MAG TPA: ImcF-related family protein [Terriglobales bacterium]|jgi:type VI secretion system protein ImpL|nr:ImcF-related family protein [Terriglobales bacterium]
MLTNVITTAALILYLLLAWFVGSLMGLTGTRVWVLRAGLSLIGIVAAGTFLWFRRRLTQDALLRGANAAYFLDVDRLLNEAEGKLKAAKAGKLATFPIVYVLGESNTAKTTTIQHGGLHPELLAGEPERVGQIESTASINVWAAGGAIFIEAGGKISTDSQLWTYLLRRTQPAELSTSGLPPRALVICCDCERLKSKDSAIASGRRLSERLRDVEDTLGSSFPVYVLFTKLDQIAHFAEFARALSQEEAAQVLGVTLAREKVGEALFVGDEEALVNKAFDELTFALAEKRLEFLRRELLPEKLPSLYEFPREIRKLRDAVAHFLVEVSRPVNADAACFLRGFYFSGVRAVLISETVTPPKVSAAAASVAAATRMFNLEELNALTKPSGPAVQARKVPEWSFVSRLFTEVILRDDSALKIGQQSRVRSRAGAVLMFAVAAGLLFVAGLFGFSFLQNRNLQNDVLAASRALSGSPELSAGQLATVDQLRQLERLRSSLSAIENSERNGLPLYRHLGLYTGEQIKADALRIYFANFNKLLLHPTELSLTDQLNHLSPASGDDFGEAYKKLKAYLITTVNPEKSTADFLAPALAKIWAAGNAQDPELQSLAQAQFEFYSGHLPASNPLPQEADNAAVLHARGYLKQFNGMERIYQGMLVEAAKNNPEMDFNRRYAGSAQVVIDPHVVPGAFTRGGLTVMKEALSNPDRFYGAEEWVLGEASALSESKEELGEKLSDRYTKDYLNQWRDFLKAATVLRFSGVNDATNKLRLLSGNRSPLMQLFWVAAVNTKVDLPGAAKSFDAVQRVANGATEDHPIGAGVQSYLTSLNGLQGNLYALAAAPEGTDLTSALNSALLAAGAARSTVGQVAQGFLIDPDGHVDSQVRKLMEDPISAAEALVRRMAMAQRAAANPQR